MRRRSGLLFAAVLVLGLSPGTVSATPKARASAGSVKAAVAENYTWRNAEIVGGGFVTGIVYNRTEPGLVYARTDIGGFRHDDLAVSPRAGMSANPVFSTTTSLDYAGTAPAVVVRVGEGDDIMHAAYSTDGGTSWTPVASQPSTSAAGGTVAVAADGSTFVWTPQDGSAHYSRDRGDGWTQSSGLPAGVTVAADRVNPDRFYAFDAGSGTFHVSNDGGASFTATVSDLPTGQGTVKTVLGREGDVWLATGAGGLFHSTDGGASFTEVAAVTEAYTIGLGKHAPGHSYPAPEPTTSILNGTDRGTRPRYGTNTPPRPRRSIDAQHSMGALSKKGGTATRAIMHTHEPEGGKPVE